MHGDSATATEGVVTYVVVALFLASLYCLVMWCRDEWRRFQWWSRNVYPFLEPERGRRTFPRCLP